MKNKENRWKIATIAFVIICLFLVGNLINRELTEEVYNFDGLEIERTQLNELANHIEGDTFNLCNINENKCVVVKKVS